MNNGNGEQRFDEDILRCKAEILRLKGGGVPPLGQPPKRTSTSPAEKRQKSESATESTPPPAEKKRAEHSWPYMSDGAFSDTATYSSPTYDGQEQFEAAARPQESAVMAESTASQEQEADLTSEKNSILAAIEHEAAQSDKAEPESEDDPEVPGFDLAEQIMAAQRKITGNRRKGPGSAKEADQEPPKPTADIQPPVASVISPPQVAPIRIVAMEAPMSPQQKVIADIVARDINKYYQARKVS